MREIGVGDKRAAQARPSDIVMAGEISRAPSRRQREILALVAAGLGDKQIAHELGVSRRTIRTHLERFYRVHGLHSRAAAAVHWLTHPERLTPLDARAVGPFAELRGRRRVTTFGPAGVRER